MNIKHKKALRPTLLLLSLFLGSATCYGKFPGRVIVDNETEFPLAITAHIYIDKDEFYAHIGCVGPDSEDQHLEAKTDFMPCSPINKNNVEIKIGNFDTIRQALDIEGSTRYVIKEDGKQFAFLVTVDMGHKYNNCGKLTRYEYNILVEDSPLGPEDRFVINTVYMGLRYAKNNSDGHYLKDEKFWRPSYYDNRYYDNSPTRGTKCAADVPVECVGRGLEHAVEGVNYSIGNIF